MPVLSPQQVADFQRDGYLLSSGLLSADELATFGPAVDAAVASRTVDDTRSLADKGLYEQSFVQCMRLWETDSAVAPLTFHPALAESAAQLLGAERVRLWQDQALYKEPGGRETDAHQDATFWPIGDTPLVSVWIPLAGSTFASGAMGYVPGSHKAGRLHPVDLTYTTEPYDILSDPALGGSTTTYVEAPTGSVIWHHGLTVHQAMANTTDAPRRVFTIVYIADGYPRDAAWPVFPLDRDGVEAGEPMEGPGMPIVWPREPGDIPPVPEVTGEQTGPQFEVPQ
ncbi:MAG: phytanoyl-CoA dioxygenase family protein [Acidimicrobiales bacterium]|jgi:ectoine hydroxylase-related dioxygenase (phytanoyl-CoA dioxygenase family)|nr:phytanoyl-CoA dioxygenase family protein [Acidimicrobiales bacterium]